VPPQYKNERRQRIVRKIPLIRAGSQWRSTSSRVVCTVDSHKDGFVCATTGVGSGMDLGHSFKLSRRLFLQCYRPLTHEELVELGQRADAAEPRGADSDSGNADPPQPS
jgi:hypothetical protein